MWQSLEQEWELWRRGKNNRTTWGGGHCEVRVRNKCYQRAIATVTLEGGSVGKVQHNIKFGTGTRNYHTHLDNLPRKGIEQRDGPSYCSNKRSKQISWLCKSSSHDDLDIINMAQLCYSSSSTVKFSVKFLQLLQTLYCLSHSLVLILLSTCFEKICQYLLPQILTMW